VRLALQAIGLCNLGYTAERGCRSLPLTPLGRQAGQAVRARVAVTG
jgi:hypothetical protein